MDVHKRLDNLRMSWVVRWHRVLDITHGQSPFSALAVRPRHDWSALKLIKAEGMPPDRLWQRGWQAGRL